MTSVVDGDTVKVTGGETIRLIGIDAPESGQCGATDATLHLRHLVLNQTVALRPGAQDDRDRYGRLLRYVETASVDAGLNMVQNGFAVARYDSRDGYGAHTREAAYVAADAGTPNVCGFDPTARLRRPRRHPHLPPAPQPPAGGGCHPNYSPCLPTGGRPGLRRDRRPPQAGARHRRLRSLPARRRRGRLRLRRRLTAPRRGDPVRPWRRRSAGA